MRFFRAQGEAAEGGLNQGIPQALRRLNAASFNQPAPLIDFLVRKDVPRGQAIEWLYLATLTRRVPESLRQMLDAQLARLRPEEQRLLEVASVAGAEFTAHVSAVAANLESEPFEALCETLARRQPLLLSTAAVVLTLDIVTEVLAVRLLTPGQPVSIIGDTVT